MKRGGVRGLAEASGPQIAVLEPTGEEVVLGAFQRARSALQEAEVAVRGLTVTRRFSGGPAVLAGPGTLHLALTLPSPGALVPCEAPQIVNRYVRPLLRALTRLGKTAHYFGRDWVSVAHRPAAWIGMGHDAASGATLVEAFVAVSHPFALPAALSGYPAPSGPPFLGKSPGTLVEITGASIDTARAREAILTAYDEAFGAPIARAAFSAAELRPPARDDRPPWEALVEDAIGFAGAGFDPPEIGGDFMGSDDLVAELSSAFAGLEEASASEIAEVVARILERSAGVVEGLKDRGALAAVMARALARRRHG